MKRKISAADDIFRSQGLWKWVGDPEWIKSEGAPVYFFWRVQCTHYTAAHPLYHTDFIIDLELCCFSPYFRF